MLDKGNPPFLWKVVIVDDFPRKGGVIIIQAWGGASQKHQEMVKFIIDTLLNRGCAIIAADYPGFNAPEKVKRHQPDVIAVNRDNYYFFGEAKTIDDLNNIRSQEQAEDFTSYSNASLILCVPNEYKENVLTLMKYTSLGAEILYYHDTKLDDLLRALLKYQK